MVLRTVLFSKPFFFNPILVVHAIYNKIPSINKEMISSTYG